MTHASAPQIFPSFFADPPDRQQRLANLLVSFALHGAGVLLVILIALYWTDPHVKRPWRLGVDVAPLSPITYDRPGGRGGGGTHSPLAASKGAVPELSLREQLTPPEAVPVNDNPKLPEPPSVMALSAVPLPHVGPLGDPLSVVQGPPSNGPGSGSGIGDGCCGGIGSKTGPGLGDADGMIFHPGTNGVAAPHVIYDPEPEYSDEARKVHQQGSVVLWLVVGSDGHTRNIRVQRSLGMGLDEKAIEAVSRWKFQPAMLNGRAVPVWINVELSFRLY